MDQAPVQIGQFILGKNLGIGAFGKVRIGRTFMSSIRIGSKKGINAEIAAPKTACKRASF